MSTTTLRPTSTPALSSGNEETKKTETKKTDAAKTESKKSDAPKTTTTTTTEPRRPTAESRSDASRVAMGNDALRKVQLFARLDLSALLRGAPTQQTPPVTGGTTPVAPTSGTGPRTAEQAVADVRNHFIQSTGPGTVGGTMTNYVDVTTPADADTTRLLTENQPLADAARAQLSPEDQARYDGVQASLAADPSAQLALQTMLIDGRLPGEKASKGATLASGECTVPLDLLGQLDLIARDPADSAVHGGGELLATVVKEVAFPECINQGGKGTCTVTSGIVALAFENPAEYARIAHGLASPRGQVEMANGDMLVREANTLADDGSNRTVTQRLMAPALMEYGNDAEYDNVRDGAVGLWSAELDRAVTGLFGREFDNFNTITTDFGLAESNANVMIEALEAGKSPVFFSIQIGGGLHQVLARDVETVGGVKYVTFQNPWGQEERISYDELKAARVNFVVQPA